MCVRVAHKLDEQLPENCVPVAEERMPHSLSYILTLTDLVGSDEEVPWQEMSYTLEVEDDVRK